MDSIIATDAPLLADTANLGLEDKGMVDDFEKTATHSIVHDPVKKLKNTSGHGNDDDLDHVLEEEVKASLNVSGKHRKEKLMHR